MYVFLSDAGWTQELAKAYLEEALPRQLGWIIYKNQHDSNPNEDKYHPELLVLQDEGTVSPYRLVTTFKVN